MPRGRKRRFNFIPQPWIPSSDDEDQGDQRDNELPGVPYLPPQLLQDEPVAQRRRQGNDD